MGIRVRKTSFVNSFVNRHREKKRGSASDKKRTQDEIWGSTGDPHLLLQGSSLDPLGNGWRASGERIKEITFKVKVFEEVRVRIFRRLFIQRIEIIWRDVRWRGSLGSYWQTYRTRRSFCWIWIWSKCSNGILQFLKEFIDSISRDSFSLKTVKF